MTPKKKKKKKCYTGHCAKGSLCQSTFSVMCLISQWLCYLIIASSQICGIILAPFFLSHPCLIHHEACWFSFRICPGSNHFHPVSLPIMITLVSPSFLTRITANPHLISLLLLLPSSCLFSTQ